MNLYESINQIKAGIREHNPEILEIPSYILENLKYDFFAWQKDALENLLYYENPKSRMVKYPTHLLFNMATGSGKTLIMAAMILHYYKKGYRHFLFFVNQNNIVSKTENNFIDSAHPKYLFTDKIVIDDKSVAIRKVNKFTDEPQGIEIKFTTVQQLYLDIHIEKENQTTLDDLHQHNLVMLADEAHHLNANTQNVSFQLDFITEGLRGKEGMAEKKGWEHTVLELVLNRDGRFGENRNVMLEFTATVPENRQVEEKYRDKIIYRFDLREFLSVGHTKQINLMSSSLPMKDRVLLALAFNWYRCCLALKYRIPNFKPVILFRSKGIKESKSDYDWFMRLIEDLTGRHFDFLDAISEHLQEQEGTLLLYDQGKSKIRQLLRYIKDADVSHADIAGFVKRNFLKYSVMITNSETNRTGKEKTTTEQEALLNNLEDPFNPIRAIFTVQRLTEGWDVLNLFDIVRLYDTRDVTGDSKAGSRKSGKSTVAEKQLIGRGVRYYPFVYGDRLPNKRKFDGDMNHELRLLEDLFFHSNDDHRYISELKNALREDGYIDDDRQVREFALKEAFLETNFYQSGVIWQNESVPNPKRRQANMAEASSRFPIQYKVHGFSLREQQAMEMEDGIDLDLFEAGRTEVIKVKDIGRNVFDKALHILASQNFPLAKFCELKEVLKIDSMCNLQDDKFLGNYRINIIMARGMKYGDMEANDKLNIAVLCLKTAFSALQSFIHPKVGSEFKQKPLRKVFGGAKIKAVDTGNERNSEDLARRLQNEDWFVVNRFVGTSEERQLVEFISDNIGNLRDQYKEVYLLKNEEIYTIYDFVDGRGFQPDFLLFLEDKKGKFSYYQVFIEPKGGGFADLANPDNPFGEGKEGWKEKFLDEITSRYGPDKVLTAENKKYRLVGLPFFNERHKNRFEEKFWQYLTPDG